ncbi:SET domain-containing protein [Dichomitus squalens LYAD-421 SS1]|uniref:SET domain-containing protein n=1 Tax=Dichomitus squalens (strain LYAD-421) TaxID=732165 RepID=R7SXS9_DICSQ|nr:SET domain-containing protein [Dichomitus squalens LYAD-421 SS1]EJF60540.1 SET domain-containing protein [Dichomitus squalens LYAD-421 SS1]
MSDASFTMQDIPGKGKGLVATRPIARGELILAEEPLLSQSQPHSIATVLAALSSLSDNDQRRYFSLANALKGDYSPPLGIFKTNALPCGDNDASRGHAAASAAIFVIGSRFNSSCQPNVNNYWNEDLQKIAFWATSDIAEGEELCICYGDLWKARDDRRRRLESSFRFVCQCVACSREGASLKESDERRNAIAKLYDEIGACGNTPSVGVRKVKLALRLLAEENLLECHASFYYDAFQFCVSVSDVKNAKAWVTKAWEAFSVIRGPDSEDAKRMATYMKDVRQHRSFGLLPRAKLSGPET